MFEKGKEIFMKQYVIKRVLSAIPLLIVISFVCFVFINLIPSPRGGFTAPSPRRPMRQ